VKGNPTHNSTALKRKAATTTHKPKKKIFHDITKNQAHVSSSVISSSESENESEQREDEIAEEKVEEGIVVEEDAMTEEGETIETSAEALLKADEEEGIAPIDTLYERYIKNISETEIESQIKAYHQRFLHNLIADTLNGTDTEQ
jgi:hypothetical protein